MTDSGVTQEPGLVRRLLGGTGWQALAQMLPLVFNLALTPFVIHGLGVGIYGIFLLVMVIQQFIGSVDGGVGPSARRYFGMYAGRGDRAATSLPSGDPRCRWSLRGLGCDLQDLLRRSPLGSWRSSPGPRRTSTGRCSCCG